MARLMPREQSHVIYILMYVLLVIISFSLITGKYICYGMTVAGFLVAFLLSMRWLIFARRTTPLRRERRVWGLLLSSIAFLSLGYLLRTTDSVFHLQVSVAVVGHILTICGYCLLWTSLLKRSGKFTSYYQLTIDILILLATSAFFYLLTWHNTGLSHVPLVWGRIYFTLAVMTLVATQAMLSRSCYQHAHRPQIVLTAGIILIVLADFCGNTGFLLVRNQVLLCLLVGTVGWLCCSASACWESHFYRYQSARSRTFDPLPSIMSIQLPLGMLVVALAVCLFPHVVSVATGVTRVIVISLIILAALRQIFTVMQYRSLYSGLQARYTEVAKHAATDPLTGLANYRMFMNCLTVEMRRAKRYRRPLALLFCDLDYFKLINDTYGHFIGDRALQAIAECLQRDAREHDIVARYGGEEFVILLPETTLSQALVFAERVRLDVTQLRIPQRHGPDVTLTMSGGISAYPESCDSLDSLLSTSDHAMYLAKHGGRNQIVVAEQHLPVHQPAGT